MLSEQTEEGRTKVERGPRRVKTRKEKKNKQFRVKNRRAIWPESQQGGSGRGVFLCRGSNLDRRNDLIANARIKITRRDTEGYATDAWGRRAFSIRVTERGTKFVRSYLLGYICSR